MMIELREEGMVGKRVRMQEKVGTVIDELCHPDGVTTSVCIEFDEYMGGHDNDGKGKAGHCWWYGKRHVTEVK